MRRTELSLDEIWEYVATEKNNLIAQGATANDMAAVAVYDIVNMSDFDRFERESFLEHPIASVWAQVISREFGIPEEQVTAAFSEELSYDDVLEAAREEYRRKMDERDRWFV